MEISFPFTQLFTKEKNNNVLINWYELVSIKSMLHATAVLSEFEELYQVLFFFNSKGRYGNVVESKKFMQGVGNTVY